MILITQITVKLVIILIKKHPHKIIFVNLSFQLFYVRGRPGLVMTGSGCDRPFYHHPIDGSGVAAEIII